MCSSHWLLTDGGEDPVSDGNSRDDQCNSSERSWQSGGNSDESDDDTPVWMLPLKRLADAARGGRVADDGSVDWGHVPTFSDPVSWSRDEAPQGIRRLVYTDEEPDFYLDVLSESEAKLYQLMIRHKWKVQCLKDVTTSMLPTCARCAPHMLPICSRYVPDMYPMFAR